MSGVEWSGGDPFLVGGDRKWTAGRKSLCAHHVGRNHDAPTKHVGNTLGHHTRRRGLRTGRPHFDTVTRLTPWKKRVE